MLNTIIRLIHLLVSVCVRSADKMKSTAAELPDMTCVLTVLIPVDSSGEHLMKVR